MRGTAMFFPMRAACFRRKKKPTTIFWRWAREITSNKKFYSTISFSPEGRFPQQQHADIRHSRQQRIMMALFIARSTSGVNPESTDQ
jgi:hypothetical protein